MRRSSHDEDILRPILFDEIEPVDLPRPPRLYVAVSMRSLSITGFRSPAHACAHMASPTRSFTIVSRLSSCVLLQQD